jgi:integrase
LTARQTFIRVKEFFNYYNKELSSKELKFLRNKLPKGNARTMEKDRDIETIRTILQHLDVKGRALVLVLASSGMRMNEALSITLDDIDLSSKPACLAVRGATTKTGDTRITFISTEASQAVTEWLKVRANYIRSSANRNNGLVKSGRGAEKTSDDDGRLFPFSDQNASAIWDVALVKAGLLSRDKTTNRNQLHYHQFRKYFISQLSLVVSKEIAEMLAGHNGYLTGAYRRYTRKQLAEEYLKGEHVLTIQAPKELLEIESEFKAEMQNHSKIIENLIMEKIALKEEIERMKDDHKKNIEQIKAEMSEIHEIVALHASLWQLSSESERNGK